MTVEKYLWDDLTRLLAVYDGNNALVMRFEYALGRTPLSMVRSGATYYFAYDQVGSLRAVSNLSGTVVKKVEYDAFGNILSDTNPSLTVPVGFAGGCSVIDSYNGGHYKNQFRVCFLWQTGDAYDVEIADYH